MKKLFIIAVVLITGITANKVSAQDKSTGTTTLSVTLDAVQSITVNQNAVALNFTTSANYLTGVNAIQANHLTFASTSGFAITAMAGSDLTGTGTTGGPIPISTVKITASPGSTGTLPVVPSTAEQPLSKDAPITVYSSPSIVTAGGTTQANLNINYMASGGTNYLNRTGTFSSTITYTIAPL